MRHQRFFWGALTSLGLACSGGDPGAPGAGGGAGVDGGSLGGSGAALDAGGTTEDIVATLARHLTGRFDSTDDAANNPNHFAIGLTICRAPVAALGPNVLYVEQAKLDTPSKPYRQRLYVIETGEDASRQVVSRVFELKTPAAFVGWCDADAPEPIQASDADEKLGCAVRLEFDVASRKFTGGTVGKGCASTLAGASYATSEVTLDEKALLSWDRGFDQQDAQVWGATDGPYVFARRTPLED